MDELPAPSRMPSTQEMMADVTARIRARNLDPTARRAEENFLVEMKGSEGQQAVPSVEEQVTPQETSEELEAHAQAQLDRLRAVFKTAGDEVNLLWMNFRLAGETDVSVMAKRSGRNVEDFNLAQQRRKRAVRRLLAEDRGVPYEEAKQ